MLVVPRARGQTLIITTPDCDITVAFLGMDGNLGRVGIEAPPEYAIIRGENDRRDAEDVPSRPKRRPRLRDV